MRLSTKGGRAVAGFLLATLGVGLVACSDEDVVEGCGDEPGPEVGCGLNGQGVPLWFCEEGEWVESDCEDEDVCENGSETELHCELDPAAKQPFLCEDGQYVPSGICVSPDPQE